MVVVEILSTFHGPSAIVTVPGVRVDPLFATVPAVETFLTNCYHVVGVNRFQICRHLIDPTLNSIHAVLIAITIVTSWFINQIPRKNGGVILINTAILRILPIHNKIHVLFKVLLWFFLIIKFVTIGPKSAPCHVILFTINALPIICERKDDF